MKTVKNYKSGDIYKSVAITIYTNDNNHTIHLSTTDATRHVTGSYNEALTYAMRWIDFMEP